MRGRVDERDRGADRFAPLGIGEPEDHDLEGLLPTAGPTPGEVVERREELAYMTAAVAQLPERLRVVVEQYFLDERPMAEIAEQLGVSESRVSQMRAEALVLMVAPVAPHLAEELWSRLGHEESLAHADFPVADESKMVESSVTCVIQIKGKVRDRVEVPSDIGEDELRELALAREKVVAATADGVRTVIVRAPKLVNVVPV